MLNLTGPKNAECVPMRNSATSSSGALRSWKPTAAKDMIATSAALTTRITRALSHLSAICPAVVEKRTKGAVKSAALRLTSVSAVRLTPPSVPKARKIASAFRKTLSLSAPRNWAQKNGPKRLVRSSASSATCPSPVGR
jgi:hypothetical protein